MEGAYAKEFHKLEEAARVLLLRNLLPGHRDVPHGRPPQPH